MALRGIMMRSKVSPGQINMDLTARQHGAQMARQQHIDRAPTQFLHAGRVLADMAVRHILQHNLTIMEDGITGEEVVSLARAHLEAEMTIAMAGRLDGLQLEIADGDRVSLTQLHVDGTGLIPVVGRIESRALGHSQAHTLLIALAQIVGRFSTEVDAGTGDRAQAGGAAGMIGVLVCQDDMANAGRVKAVLLHEAQNLILAESRAGIDQRQFLTPIKEIDVAIEGVGQAQAHEPAADEIDAPGKFHRRPPTSWIIAGPRTSVHARMLARSGYALLTSAVRRL